MRHQTLLIQILILLSLLAGCIGCTGCSSLSALGGNGSGGSGNINALDDVPAKNEDAEGLSLRDDPLWSDEESLTAMIISDLHYTEYKEVDPLLVPGIALAPEITDVIVSEVIDRHPDVLIMTGDNTNSGYSEDMAGLIPKLQKIKDNGISIVITTGNHDFDLMDAEGFEKAYFGLLAPTDRDPASLSYTAIVKDVVFLAMDDNAVSPGGQGEFSAETMQWIRKMLSKYSTHPIIFLSHHNVLYGYGEDDSVSHLIQNPELTDLLQDGGVKLAMTGHMHFPYISYRDGLWEILSGMPFSGSHLIGNLAVGDNRMVYYAEPINFAVYGGSVNASSVDGSSVNGSSVNGSSVNGSSVKEELDRLDQESSEYMDQVFSGLLDKEGLRGAKKKKVMELIDRYFLYFYSGTLAGHTQELKEDPSYELMIKALWNYNYGPWMQAMIETTKYDARELEVK